MKPTGVAVYRFHGGWIVSGVSESADNWYRKAIKALIITENHLWYDLPDCCKV